jgi:transposase
MTAKKAGTPTTSMTLQTPFPPEPLADDERLYVGVDIGKEKHYAGFVSPTLLKINKKWQNCPWMEFPRSRAGFDALLAAILLYVPLDRLTVIFEHTGHYSRAMQDFLLAQQITAYRLHVSARPNRLIKNDKRDALALAVLGYNRLTLGVQSTERGQDLRLVIEDLPSAKQLRPLVQHRLELVKHSVAIQNRLTSLNDELFPEFTQVYSDPNSPSALVMRLVFPTPHDVAQASIDALCATRKRNLPARADLLRLQELAATSICVQDPLRVTSLALEQRHLIAHLQFIQVQIEAVDGEIKPIISESREGRILMSMGLGEVAAATFLAFIGNLANFQSAGKLRSLFGWSPQQQQTGSSMDSQSLARSGNKTLKQMIYMVVLGRIRSDETWRKMYDRLVARKCEQQADGTYRGKKKVIGRLAGQMIGIMYVLLKKDADLLAALKEGEPIPEPELYSTQKHEKARRDSEAAVRRRATERKAN